MRTANDFSRRKFMTTVAGAATGPFVLPACVLGRGRTGPNGLINVGVVGLGSRGFNLLTGFLREDDARVVGLCDVDSHHYRDQAWGEGKAYGREPAKEMVERYYGAKAGLGNYAGVDTCVDYRELCARTDVDVVVVATPDHWHALCTLEALRNGKDVYCEKPVTHFFREGQAVYREVAKRKSVFQAGSQQRSEARFRRAAELVLNGHIGKVLRVEVGLPEGYPGPMGDATMEPPPDHVDYDLWCGPSPKLPYMRARHHRWWRGHRAYGGGVLMDWIGHHNDIAHWALGLDTSGPRKVEAVGWRFPETDIYNTPRHYEIQCEYAGGAVSSISNRHEIGAKWVGEDGWVYVCRRVVKGTNPEWSKLAFDPGPVKVYDSPGHVRNFLDCCRSRETCAAPAETAHRSITPGHLGYVSDALGRPLHWDPAKERVEGDEEADRLLKSFHYRAPWDLPMG